MWCVVTSAQEHGVGGDGLIGGADNVVLVGLHLRVLHKQLDLRRSRLVNRGVGDDLEVGTSCVDLVLAVWQTWIGVGHCRPLPDPIHGQRASLRVCRDLDVGFAPLLVNRSRLPRNRIWKFLLTSDRNGTAIDLVATAVVEVLNRQETTLAECVVGGPRENVCKCLVRNWSRSRVDVDESGRARFAQLILRKRDVAVLEIFHCDVIAWTSNKRRKILSVVAWSALRRFAEQI